MRFFLDFCVFFILLFLSCSTILLDESSEGNHLDLLALKALMAYPELKISNSVLKKYANLNDSFKHNFDILKGDQESLVYISESSYNDNIEYIKALYLYNQRLYKIILAYSIVQGESFKFEVLRYLNNNIKEKFPLRINFPSYSICIDDRLWIVVRKIFFHMLVQDKNALIIAKRKLESILESFSK
ncbi:hypothetical protein baBA2_000899 (plasmid) [Borrelia anserina]|uniref:Lipoprotein n=2 Tax=Borrelia anserina TaxID=143 RepID=W5SVF6_BORAN|nr:hypothetical protein [Borrelia anserina]AHH09011.1 Hypothetical protein BAN_0017200 [Borrelia anserina BA2]APR65406.1 putative lipoprotein [Borrelia anserina Es]UPA07274.1 hypothetical protein baBA2_000899 [Borrelia anserina]